MNTQPSFATSNLATPSLSGVPRNSSPRTSFSNPSLHCSSLGGLVSDSGLVQPWLGAETPSQEPRASLEGGARIPRFILP